MADNLLEGIRIAILATDGVEQVELTEPRKAFEDAGARTTLIALRPGKIQGMKHHEKADKLDIDMSLDDARPENFDAVLLPGGALNADALRMSETARNFVRAMDAAGKPFAIICHAPWLLVSAGLVKGRSMTSYHTIQDDMRNAGAEWSDREVVIDRNWVMSRQPSDMQAFKREAIRLFSQKRSQ